MKNQPGFVTFLVIIVIVALIAGGAMYYFTKQGKNDLTTSGVSVTAGNHNSSNVNRNSNANANLNVNMNSAANSNSNLNSNSNINTNGSASTTTADWKTYTDTTNKFSFQYPADMTAVDHGETIGYLISSDNSKTVTVNILDGTLDPTNIQGIDGKVTATVVPIGSQNGYRYAEGTTDCGGTFVQTALAGGKILKIYFGECNGNTNLFETDKTLQGSFLSTFQFTK